MRKRIVFVFFVVAVVSMSYGQGAPKEIQFFIENYLKEPTARYGVLRAKRVMPSVQAEDLSVRILEMYRFKHIFLDVYPDTVSFSELIEPSGYWRVLVMAHNKPLYELFLDNSKESPIFIGSSTVPLDGTRMWIWTPFLEIYPELTEGYPILFSRSGVPYLPEDGILYFKYKGPRQIRYLRLRHSDEAFLDTLSDSRELMRYWKRKKLNEVGISDERRRQRSQEIEYERRRAQENKNGGSK